MNDIATQETIAVAAVAAAKVLPSWVARVLPLVEALMNEYKAKYKNETNALTQKDRREGLKAATNPNIWTHLACVVDYFRAGDYDEAVEMLGTMVGMGRGIGAWVGGDAGRAIENLIESIRAETDNTHPVSPNEAERNAGQAAIGKKRYLRLAGMSGDEALFNDRFSASFGGQNRLDLVKADDPKIHPPYRRGQYLIFKRDGQLYARQWNVANGFHDRLVTIIEGEPFNPVSPPPQKGTETADETKAAVFEKGCLVAWTAGGHQLVGELLNIDGDKAVIARLVSGSGIQPELKTVPQARLRLATPDGAEATAVEAHHKNKAQQQQWLAYHDKQFETYIPSSSPDFSYTNDFTLTSEAMLREGRAHVVEDGLIRGGHGQVYVERIENRFGKVVELHGYRVEPAASWTFITRPAVPGQLPKYGTIIKGGDGKSYVIREKHTWEIMSQLSAGERVRVKSSGEESIIKGDSQRRCHGAVVYSLENGGLVQSIEVVRVDTQGDRVITKNGSRESAMATTTPPTKPTVIYLPLEEFEQAFHDSYAVMHLCNQSIRDGVAKPVGVPAINLRGVLVTNTGGCSHGLDSTFDAWELVPEPSFVGATTTLYHDEDAIDAGRRDRGDHTGLIVTYRGIRFVFSRKIKVRSAAPSIKYAVSLADVLKRDETEKRWGWRPQFGNSVRWVEKAGFVLGVFGKPGEEEQVMLYYKNKKGEIEETYVKNIDSFTGPVSDVGKSEEGKGAMTKFKFEKDEIVTYKGNQYYWIGRKVGSFRLLSSQPGTESGFLVPESEIGETVFPAPNEHGVFSKKHASLLEFKKNSNFYVRIYILQISNNAWAGAMETKTSMSGHSSPLRATCAQASYEAVVKQEMGPIIAGLAANAAGRSFPGWSSFKPAMAKQAILALLSQIPQQLASEIIIYARSRAGEHRG